MREAAADLVVLDFADEQSVEQTRFATSTVALLRAHLGPDLTGAVAEARTAVTEDLPAALPAAEQTTFLGTGCTYGLTQEAALKMREAAGAWTESYPAMEYRHGRPRHRRHAGGEERSGPAGRSGARPAAGGRRRR